MPARICCISTSARALLFLQYVYLSSVLGLLGDDPLLYHVGKEGIKKLLWISNGDLLPAEWLLRRKPFYCRFQIPACHCSVFAERFFYLCDAFCGEKV